MKNVLRKGVDKNLARRIYAYVAVLILAMAGTVYATGTELNSITLTTGNNHAPLLYGGTNVMKTTAAMTNGQLLIGSTGADPTPAAVTFGSGSSAGLSGTTGAGSLQLNGVAVVGDAGSGGTQGMVPAPGAGDAAAGKFLKADGTFAVPSVSSLNGLTDTVSAKTTSYSVLTGDSYKVFTNGGAGGTVNFTLPTAAAGLHYTFVITTAQTVTITAGASTTIQVGGTASTSAGNFSATTVGYVLVIEGIDSTHWFATAGLGAWVGA